MQQVQGAIRGGVDVVQVREPDLDGREHVRLVRAIMAIRFDAATRVLVNDRADVALAAGADGVHLREASIAVESARRLLGHSRRIGRSVHDASGVLRSSEADYVIAGPVFGTESKPGLAPTLGLNGLRRLADIAGDCPVWAIGGLTPERVGSLVRAGARGIAAIGGFIPALESGDIAQAVEKLTKSWRFSFDSAVELS